MTDHGSAAVGVAGIFDFNELWHLVGSANTGISSAGADQFSFNLALKWTP
jgi:energy-converting hydrogenase Eha subunit H